MGNGRSLATQATGRTTTERQVLFVCRWLCQREVTDVSQRRQSQWHTRKSSQTPSFNGYQPYNWLASL
jgi:hypothetical protein